MKQVVFAAVVLSLAATMASAMPTDVDTNRDGFASLTELRAVYLDITDERFIEIDFDGDGLINDEEMLIAIDAMLISKADAYV
ncbi:hypothetical protein Q4539_15960 [Yoonia sp. 1_MG-2023]|nr:hypothetical protein [Yoonia sp. 1_MG-2023]